MFEQVHARPANLLDLADYWADFSAHEAQLTGDRCHKLERSQYFAEPGDPSWQAFMAGDWQEALRLNELARPEIEAEFDDTASRGVEWRRVRVIEFPITAYLQWEMHGLKIMAEYGEHIRVVRVADLAEYETRHRVPEVVVLGTSVLDDIRYDARSAVRGSPDHRNRDHRGVPPGDRGALRQRRRFLAVLQKRDRALAATEARRAVTGRQR